MWVIYGVNFFGTIARRRERGLYAALWFFGATILTIAMLYIFNNLEMPVSLRGSRTRSTPAFTTPTSSGGTGTTRSASC